MEKVRYMISDAADIVHVETHVLRYWEEELDLAIPRNEMGHRYYTKENIQQFQRIKELKEQGYQLKAIRMMLHEGEVVHYQSAPGNQTPACKPQAPQIVSIMDDPEERMAQFRLLMSEIVGQAIAQNNEALGLAVGKEVEERVLKEMNYLMREQDAAEEERFQKLLNTIFTICELAGFHIEGRIAIKDCKTGKIWR